MRWWVVHRRLFGQAYNLELVDALTQFCVATYRVLPEQVWDAARHRAQAMLCSNLWVHAGKPEQSPLLADEEQELILSYTALRTAVQRNHAENILDSRVSFVL